MNSTELAKLISPAPTIASDLSNVKVGDVVAVFSRNALRNAEVIKVGPKNVVCQYTTKGAVDDVTKFADGWAGVNRESYRAGYNKLYADNFAHAVQGSNPATARYAHFSADHCTKAVALVAEGREAYINSRTELELVRYDGYIARANALRASGDYASQAHVTTVTIKRANGARV